MRVIKRNSGQVVAIWYARSLGLYNGLALKTNRKWSIVVPDSDLFSLTTKISREEYTKEALVAHDINWHEGFKKIIQFGLLPNSTRQVWQCSCGSEAKYGKYTKLHAPHCSYYDTYEKYLLPEDAPKNNDGRDYCYICSMPTETVAGVYQLCKNKQCRWYDN